MNYRIGRPDASSRHLVEWVEAEPFGRFCPGYADEFLGRARPLRGPQSTSEVIGIQEVSELLAELLAVRSGGA